MSREKTTVEDAIQSQILECSARPSKTSGKTSKFHVM
jgi:hypothetical protein